VKSRRRHPRATIVIETSTLEGRILKLLLEKYPATVADLEFALRIPAERLQRTLKALQSRGIVEVETVGEKTYVRLLRTDFSFVGRQVTQRRRVKRTGRTSETKDYEGPMFG